MSQPLSVVLIAPCTRALQPLPTAVPVNAISCILDEGNILEQTDGASWVPYSPTGGTGAPSNTVAAIGAPSTAGVSSQYSRGDHIHAQAMLSADPASPVNGTWWVVDDGVSLDIRARKAGVTYVLASLTLP